MTAKKTPSGPVLHVLGCGARTAKPKVHDGYITCDGCGLRRPVAQFQPDPSDG